jgi:hypothetical protein
MGVWPVARVQKTPEPVSWDKIQTEPRAPVVQPAPVLLVLIRKLRLPATPVFWVLLGVGVVAVIGALTIGRPGNATQIPTATPTSIPIGSAPSPQASIISPTASSVPEITPLNIPGSSQTPSAESTALTPTLGNKQCQYTVKAGDTISKTFENFDPKPAYTDFSCSQQDTACTYDPNNPEKINIGWVLTIKNVKSTDCQSIGGIVIP